MMESTMRDWDYVVNDMVNPGTGRRFLCLLIETKNQFMIRIGMNQRQLTVLVSGFPCAILGGVWLAALLVARIAIPPRLHQGGALLLIFDPIGATLFFQNLSVFCAVLSVAFFGSFSHASGALRGRNPTPMG